MVQTILAWKTQQILRNNKNRVQVQTAKHLLKNVSHIQLKTMYKYCYSWQKRGLLLRRNKANCKQNITKNSNNGRRPVIAKRTIKNEVSLLYILLMWLYNRTHSGA